MFKLKPGNVFQKINKMDKKQAYTWGAIVVVCFIALITLASFMGDADDTSFDGFNTRGYDLAQMPFMNDEAEEYLLASKYPDMKENNSTLLYSAAEKEARQEADAEKAAEEAAEDSDGSSDSSDYSGGYSGRGYGGYGGGGGASGPTQVGQLGSASMGSASGSGINSSWGAPRGDFSPYKSQEKGSEQPAPQLKNTDARRALSQFARTSAAAAGLKDGKGGNAKRALMGGNIAGSEAFTEYGVDLSKSGGLNLDTNAPTTSADFSGLDNAMDQAAKNKQAKDDEIQEDMEDRLLEQLLSGLVNLGVQAVGDLLTTGINAAKGGIAGAVAENGSYRSSSDNFAGQELTPENIEKLGQMGAGKEPKWTAADVQQYAETHPGARVGQFVTDRQAGPDPSIPPATWGKPEPQQPSLSSYNVSSVEALNEEQQLEYSQKKQEYERWQKEADARNAYEEGYNNLSEEEKAKKNRDYQRKVDKANKDFRNKKFKPFYKNDHSSDVYIAAQQAKQEARSAYGIGRTVFDTPATNSRDYGNKTISDGGKDWFSEYGSEYGDTKKYDQKKVAACKGHASPRECLAGAKL